jgi:hypothetical protein
MLFTTYSAHSFFTGVKKLPITNNLTAMYSEKFAMLCGLDDFAILTFAGGYTEIAMSPDGC